MLAKDPDGKEAVLVFSKLEKSTQMHIANSLYEITTMKSSAGKWTQELTDACKRNPAWLVFMSHYQISNFSTFSQGK